MFRKLFRGILWPFGVFQRRPVVCVGILLLLAATAAAGVHYWALYQFRQAEQALDDDRYDEAREHLSICLAVWPWSEPTHFLAARIARLKGDYPEAEAQLAECRRLQKGVTAQTQMEMILVRAQQGEVDEVVEGLVYASEHDPAQRRDILEALARGHMALTRYPPALALLDRCLKQYPDDVRALDYRGAVLVRLDNQERAAEDYKRVLELSPGRTEVRLRLALLYLEHNDPVLAEPHLQILIKTEPDRPDVNLALAQCRYLQGKEAEARALLERVLAAQPDRAKALLYLGKLELQAGRPEKAEEYFRRALKNDPNNGEVVNCLYDSLRGQPGREAEAAAVQKEYNRLAAIQTRMQELLNGEAERASDNPEPAYELGKLNLEIGKVNLGLYWLYAALKRDPGHKPTHALLADYYEEQGDKEESAKQRVLAAK